MEEIIVYTDAIIQAATEEGCKDALNYLISKWENYLGPTNEKESHPYLNAAFLAENVVSIVEHLLQNGSDINTITKKGNNVIFIATEKGSKVEALQKLVSLGASWNITNAEAQTILHLAAATGNVDALKYLLSEGADPNAKDEDGKTPMIHAVLKPDENYLEVVELLMKYGSDINAVTKKRNSVIFIATLKGKSVGDIKKLVELGAIWNGTNAHGYSILHVATEGGNVKALKYFISKGADPNLKNGHGNSPLMYAGWLAPEESFRAVVKVLLRKGAKINEVNNFGYNVLSIAVLSGRTLKEIKWLVGRGAVRLTCKDECTILHHVILSGYDRGSDSLFMKLEQIGVKKESESSFGMMLDAIPGVNKFWRRWRKRNKVANDGIPEKLKYFISKGEDVNARNLCEETPLLLATSLKDKFAQVAEVLLENRAMVNAVDGDNGNSVLFMLAHKGKALEDIVKLLDNHGACWKNKNKKGDTILHMALVGGSLEVTKYFLLMGADANAQNSNGVTPLMIAALSEQKSMELVNLFLEENADINAADSSGSTLLLYSASNGKTLEELSYLVDRGANWNIKDIKGNTVLHHAASGGNSEVLKYFISKGADVNARNVCDGTPLLRAATAPQNNFKSIVDCLLDNGANINDCDMHGGNLLLYATEKGKSLENMKYLVNSKGLSWKHTNKRGCTILHMAAYGGNKEVLKYFVFLGADVSARADFGRTPMMQATYSKDNMIPMVTCLLENGAEINDMDDQGMNVLFLAASNGRELWELEVLVQLGACWDVTYKHNNTILHHTAHTGNVSAANFFIAKGADVNAKNSEQASPMRGIAHCDGKNFRAMVNLFVRSGLGINTVDGNGDNLIFEAALFGRSLHNVKTLIDAGGSWKRSNYEGNFILHRAAYGGLLDVIAFFIGGGADVNARNNLGETPFLYVVKQWKQNLLVKVLQLLVDHGADVNAMDKDGNNAVLLAVTAGKPKSEVEKLVELGCDWEAPNTAGLTVMHKLKEDGKLDLLEWFLML